MSFFSEKFCRREFFILLISANASDNTEKVQASKGELKSDTANRLRKLQEYWLISLSALSITKFHSLVCEGKL